jgi:hypothetical protein
MLQMETEAFDQPYKTAQSEEAKNARYHVQAYLVLTAMGKFNAALLKGATYEEPAFHNATIG